MWHDFNRGQSAKKTVRYISSLSEQSKNTLNDTEQVPANYTPQIYIHETNKQTHKQPPVYWKTTQKE